MVAAIASYIRIVAQRGGSGVDAACAEGNGDCREYGCVRSGVRARECDCGAGGERCARGAAGKGEQKLVEAGVIPLLECLFAETADAAAPVEAEPAGVPDDGAAPVDGAAAPGAGGGGEAASGGGATGSGKRATQDARPLPEVLAAVMSALGCDRVRV